MSISSFRGEQRPVNHHSIYSAPPVTKRQKGHFHTYCYITISSHTLVTAPYTGIGHSGLLALAHIRRGIAICCKCCLLQPRRLTAESLTIFLSKLFYQDHRRCSDLLSLHLINREDTHTPLSTTLDEGSARGRCLYLHNTLQIQETKVHAPRGVRTRNSNSRLTTGLRRRSHGQRAKRVASRKVLDQKC